MGNETAVREKLRSGGELVICGGDVRIEYFFPCRIGAMEAAG